MSAQVYTHYEPIVKTKLKARKRKALSEEDIVILSTLEQLKKNLDAIHSSLDSVTDPILIDSFIYEMNAINMRYKFYIKMCKEKGLVSNIF